MRARGTGGLASVAVVVLVVAAVGTAAGAASTPNEAPLADAGLDRDVTANETVYLDATGSRDPDGEIAAFE